MKIEPFNLERWMTRHETRVRYDLAESGIHPLCVGDLLGVLAVNDGRRGLGQQALGEALLARAVVAGGAQV